MERRNFLLTGWQALALTLAARGMRSGMQSSINPFDDQDSRHQSLFFASLQRLRTSSRETGVGRFPYRSA
jgi:hypothetical protein